MLNISLNFSIGTWKSGQKFDYTKNIKKKGSLKMLIKICKRERKKERKKEIER